MSSLFCDISIDIDAVYKLYLLPAKGCYHCGDLNHVVLDCLTRLDIQQLTAEQSEELMEDLNIVKDMKA